MQSGMSQGELVAGSTQTPVRAGSESSNADKTRLRIYAGVIECVEKWGLEKTTLNDIAKAAGCSRRTLYNYFSNKTEVMAAALDDAGRDFMERVKEHALQYEDPSDSLTEAVVFTVISLPREPFLKVMTDSHFFMTFLEEFFESDLSRERVEAVTRVCLRNAPELLSQVEEIGEVTSRFVISSLMARRGVQRSESELKDFFRRRFLPGLMQP